MNQAWMFPGQGSQSPGMARRLFTDYPQSRETLVEASELSGLDLNTLRERGPMQSLMRPSVAEPLIAAVQIAFVDLLNSAGIHPLMVAGYSAGEVAAFYAAGVLSKNDALRAAIIRGAILDEYVDHEIRMISISRIANHVVEAVIRDLKRDCSPDVHIAGINAPDSLTVVGAAEVVRSLSIELQAYGGIVADVPVAGPWHTRQVVEASHRIRRELSQLEFHPPQCMLFLSATGCQEVEPQRLASALAAQISMPVLWQHIVEYFWLLGIRNVLEVGPGRVLLGMLRRNWFDFSAYDVECVESATGNIAPLKRLLATSATGINK